MVSFDTEYEATSPGSSSIGGTPPEDCSPADSFTSRQADKTLRKVTCQISECRIGDGLQGWHTFSVQASKDSHV